MSETPHDWQRFVPTLTEVVDPISDPAVVPALSEEMQSRVDSIVEQVLADNQRMMDQRLRHEFERLAQVLAGRIWREVTAQWQDELASSIRAAVTSALNDLAVAHDSKTTPSVLSSEN